MISTYGALYYVLRQETPSLLPVTAQARGMEGKAKVGALPSSSWEAAWASPTMPSITRGLLCSKFTVQAEQSSEQTAEHQGSERC